MIDRSDDPDRRIVDGVGRKLRLWPAYKEADKDTEAYTKIYEYVP